MKSFSPEYAGKKKKCFYSSDIFDVKKFDQITVEILINPDHRVVDLFGHEPDGRKKLIVSYCKKLNPSDKEPETNEKHPQM